MILSGNIFGGQYFYGDLLPYSYDWEFQYLNTVKSGYNSCPYQMDSIEFKSTHINRYWTLTIKQGASVVKTVSMWNSASQVLFSELNLSLSPDLLYTIHLNCDSGAQLSVLKTDTYANSSLIIDYVAYPTWDIAADIQGKWILQTPSTKINSIY